VTASRRTAIVVSAELPGNHAGASIVLLGCLHTLRRMGYDLRFLRDHRAGMDAATLGELAALIPRPRSRWAFFREWARNLARLVTAGYTPQWRSDTWRALSTAVRQRSPDLVFLDTLRSAEYGRLLREQGYRGRIILNEHNVEAGLMERQLAHTKALGKRLELTYRLHRFRRVESSLARFVDACLALTTVDRDWLARWNPGFPVHFAPPAIDLEHYRSAEAVGRSKELLFIGSYNWPPNLDGMQWFTSEVWPLVRARTPDARLTVVGRSPPDWLQRIEGVTATGYVDDERAYYERARVILAPLRFGSGVRLKILHALAMARPVVSTALGAEGIPIVDGESIELADTPLAFAEKIVRLLTDDVHALSVAQHGHAVCEEWYAPAAVTRRLQEAIEGQAAPGRSTVGMS
jgi:glycosyltransferase involved in cell wall biosynthesis